MQALLVDPLPLSREYLQSVLERTLPQPAVLAAPDLKQMRELLCEARDLMCGGGRPELIVLDPQLPGYSGIEVLHELRACSANARVIVVSGIDDCSLMKAAFAWGVKGWIPKTSRTEVIRAAFELIAGGATYVPPELLSARPSPSFAEAARREPRLTERQLQVLACIARAESNRRIALELGISENTVKQHVRAVLQCLGVSRRTEALIRAARLGIRLPGSRPGTVGAQPPAPRAGKAGREHACCSAHAGARQRGLFDHDDAVGMTRGCAA